MRVCSLMRDELLGSRGGSQRGAGCVCVPFNRTLFSCCGVHTPDHSSVKRCTGRSSSGTFGYHAIASFCWPHKALEAWKVNRPRVTTTEERKTEEKQRDPQRSRSTTNPVHLKDHEARRDRGTCCPVHSYSSSLSYAYLPTHESVWTETRIVRVRRQAPCTKETCGRKNRPVGLDLCMLPSCDTCIRAFIRV